MTIPLIKHLSAFFFGCASFFPALWAYAVFTNNDVVKNMEITEHFTKDGNSYIRVFGERVRECPPLGIIGFDETSILNSVVFLDDLQPNGTINPPDSQPVGKVDFGYWELNPEVKSRKVLFIVYHLCDSKVEETEFVMELP